MKEKQQKNNNKKTTTKTNKKKPQQQEANVSSHSRAFLEEKNAPKIQVIFFENAPRGLIFQSSSRL